MFLAPLNVLQRDVLKSLGLMLIAILSGNIFIHMYVNVDLLHVEMKQARMKC